ncbi:NeuD/PglB/VioB family sugar acetyltransferase [Bradyrhizobium amphicarpaeae]|uniref:PglD N-terminal domain-containing protein n=1 Tax=Bradyrhizobium amphicarpaeae TaxID=1404768 RepID=A0A2U8PTS9_9BRAD|nr:hypothetical protein CIT40_14980 [Bradyrhizobium amphicarpaeae]
MDLIVVGASTLGRDAIAVARAQGKFSVVGIVDDDPGRASIVDGVPVLGPIDTLAPLFAQVDGYAVIVAIGDCRSRYAVYNRIVRSIPTIRFATIIHPRATLLGDARVDDGSILFPGVVLGPGSHVGLSSVLNANSTIGAGTRLGGFVSIAPGVNLGSDTVIGTGVYFGMGSAVAQQIHIGDWCTIGALSFVRRDTPPGSLIVGSPGKVKKERPT